MSVMVCGSDRNPFRIEGGKLHLGLLRFSNFFQLPVRIKSITSVSGGREVKVDVFSN